MNPKKLWSRKSFDPPEMLTTQKSLTRHKLTPQKHFTNQNFWTIENVYLKTFELSKILTTKNFEPTKYFDPKIFELTKVVLISLCMILVDFFYFLYYNTVSLLKNSWLWNTCFVHIWYVKKKHILVAYSPGFPFILILLVSEQLSGSKFPALKIF